MRKHRHWWNARWGRLARRDVIIHEDPERGCWWVEAREGGPEGRSRWLGTDTEPEASSLAAELMRDSDGWRVL